MDQREEIHKIASEFVKKIADRYNQEQVSVIQDGFEKAVYSFKETLTARVNKVLLNNSSKWSEASGPVLLPQNTRLFYRKGDKEVLVQEFDPQLRSLKFINQMVDRNSSSDPQLGKTEVVSYALALPYIVFIHFFDNGIMSSTYVAFNDRPLKDLQEKPLLPYMSNINSELRLCHGSKYNSNELIKDNLTQQVAYTLDMFWQTTFVDEWSQHFWAYKSHFANHEVMSSFQKWHEKSLENNLYAIEGVTWLPHTAESFGDMIAKLFQNSNSLGELRQELYQDLNDLFMNELTSYVTDNCQNLEVNLKVDSLVDSIMESLKTN